MWVAGYTGVKGKTATKREKVKMSAQPKALHGIGPDNSLIAQPVFVFQKKDRSCKRHAEDLVCKAEHECSGWPVKRVRSTSLTHSPSYSHPNTDGKGSEKRVRSSSFTFIPTFPECQPARKNIFMSSTPTSAKNDVISADRGTKTQRNVIRPAILQPPHAQLCAKEAEKVAENVLPTSLTKETQSIKGVSQNFCPLAENVLKPGTVVGPYNCTHITPSKPPRSQPEDGTNSDFVFGENMTERVLSPQTSSDFLIESAQYKRESAFQINNAPQKTSEICETTLIESAAACTSKSHRNIKMEKVDILTGEEAERNVLQINCKLFVLNKASQSWTEKGRGSLRLNDTSSNGYGMLQSRLVMRNHGSLRLIFNTKLWAQMKIEKANRKSIHLSATDLEDNVIRVFLIQASAKDAGRLYAAIHHRLVALRITTEQRTDVNRDEAEPETGIGLLNVDSDDEDEDREQACHLASNKTDPPRWIRREPAMFL
ncbi:ran-binding protein 3-like isoform X2 [Ambystoma mexicanum]|uniref:ran-binding protein 3-like isoform X2 n=1 Tax=Ambystoma mexicanum TaxID=8296 RepID=UPI0037E95D1C